MTALDVQSFIDNNLGKDIKVSFTKKDGTVAEYVGIIPLDNKRSESVAFLTEEGYKRFNINNVISIQTV